MRTYLTMGIGLILIILLAGYTQSPPSPTTPTNSTPIGNQPTPVATNWPAAQVDALHQHQLFQLYGEKHHKTPQETADFFQRVHGLQNEKDIYAQLPTPTSRFEQDLNTLNHGNGISINTIPIESYTQPEFFSTFATSGIQTWIDAPDTPASTLGFSSTPAEQQTTLSADTNQFSTTLFIGSSWGVDYYQGMAFRYRITPPAPIHLTFSPNAILMGPTFPAFTPEWMHKITVEGAITGNLAPGTYTIDVFPNEAPNDIQEQWANEHQPYISGNGIIGPSNGFATLSINVTA